jgi:glycine hydroxymethyltransferase
MSSPPRASFGEALQPAFKTYIQQVIDNAKILAETLEKHGYSITTGGTDNHLMLVDLRNKGITGKAAEQALGRAHITCNKNGVPFDTASPMVTSGIRLGSPAATSRGFGTEEFTKIGELVAICLDGLAKNGEEGNKDVEAKVRAEVEVLTKRFPIY